MNLEDQESKYCLFNITVCFIRCFVCKYCKFDEKNMKNDTFTFANNA